MHFKEKLELYGNGETAAIAKVEKSLPIATVRFPLEQATKTAAVTQSFAPPWVKKSAMPWPL